MRKSRLAARLGRPAHERRSVWYVSITDFPRGLGSTTRARSICRALTLAGYDASLFIPYALGHACNDSPRGVSGDLSFEYLNGSSARPSGALRVALAKLRANIILARRMYRETWQPACVFVYNATIFDCWGVLAAGRLLRVPVVLDLADEWHDPAVPIRSLGLARYLYQRFARATEEAVYRRVARVIVVSRHFERRLVRHAAKTIRCPVAFDPLAFASAKPTRLFAANEFGILYAGSVSRTEGVDILIDAFRQTCPPAGKRLHLAIVGNPAHNETIADYEERARDLIAAGRVSFQPAVDHTRYASLLRGADLLVIPRPASVASNAGFPYKLAEYLASGVPVLVTRFGDVEQYFTEKVHCMMCDPDKPGALAAAIRQAIDHRAELDVVAGEGQRRVTELFAYEQVAGRLRHMIEEVARVEG